MERRVGLNSINSHILCVLCGGYFIDATTIVECLHTFCRSCIVKHLEYNNVCPICEVVLHKNGPLNSIRPDKQKQRMVYKMVEGLHSNEWERRKQFYQSQEVITEKVLDDTVKDLDRVVNFQLFKPEDPISLSLEYYDDSARINVGNDETNMDVAGGMQKRYLCCPAGVLVRHIKKFLIKKYQLNQDHRVNVYYNHALLRENFTMSDVADLYDYDRVKPMRLFFQLLELQTVTVKNATHVMVTESPPSTSIEATSPPPTNLKKSSGTSSEQTGPSCREDHRGLGKKKLRDDSNMESVSKPKMLCVDQRESVRVVPMAKRQNNKHIPIGSQTPRRIIGIQSQDVVEEVVVSKSNSISENKQVGKISAHNHCSEPTDDLTEDAEIMEVETISQTADSVGDQDNTVQDATQDIEEVVLDVEGESSQDFILQEEQQIDISEDLEEDDDEDRLRICDPEEVIEDRNGTDSFDEAVEAEPAKNDEKQQEIFMEEEVEIVRKESKSRKKNKKAKHHHRHKRDYSPAPEATIVSDDKNDIMKLKVKITRPDSDLNGAVKNKQDESAKHVKNNDSPRQSKHKPIVVSDDTDNNSIQSLNNSNMDEDSRNSQSTDDHDARSISSSKEGHDDLLSNVKETTHNGSLKQLKAKNVQVSTKAKLFQMRQVRHKNITPTTRNTNQNKIKKDSSEEIRNSPIASTVLPSTMPELTLRKLTVEAMTEERVKKMTNNNLERLVEIIPISKSNSLIKTENKTLENQHKHKGLPVDSPVVRLTKTNSASPLALSKQQSLSITMINNNNERLKNSKEIKSKTRPGEKRPDSFGVLDLSKPARSTSSSPASEGSCPSPSQTALSLTQPIIKRHVSSINSPHRASSDSPPVQGPNPSGSQNRAMQYSNHMYNLSVLSNAAVHIENKTQLAQEATKRQQLNSQKVSAPLQRYPGISPTKAPVSRASPTQLKIPNPSVSLHNKFLNRPKLPNSNSIHLQNSVRHTRPMPPVNTRPNNNFGNMLSQSAAVAKKQAGMNGRNPNIPPPPAGIPISELYKMPQKYDLEKIARGLTAARKAEVKGQSRIHSS